MTQHTAISRPQTPAALGQASSTSLSEEGQALLLLAFVLVQSGKHTQALNVLEGLRHWETQSTACLPLLTQCYLELGLFAEALPLAQELRRACVDSDVLCATRMLAQALWGLNRKEEAKAVLHKALQSVTTQSETVQPIPVEEAHALADA